MTHHEAEELVEAAKPDGTNAFVQLVEASDACDVRRVTCNV